MSLFVKKEITILPGFVFLWHAIGEISEFQWFSIPFTHEEVIGIEFAFDKIYSNAEERNKRVNGVERLHKDLMSIKSNPSSKPESISIKLFSFWNGRVQIMFIVCTIA
ncbi:hypothetical protein DFH28DRAFT_967195 [Melampsora americana]|nr:hypothetical protein DFH28DRAFT_967195 [Melampsora americana]